MIDEGEIKIDQKDNHSPCKIGGKRVSLTMKAQTALDTQKSIAEQVFSVYTGALEQAIKALPVPSSKDFQHLLERILSGFREHNKQNERFVTRLQEMQDVEVRAKQKQLTELESEYAKYRSLNDLDRYFSMNLTEETRERVLENVK